MNMNSRQEFLLKKTSIAIFGLLGFLGLFLASLYLLSNESGHNREFLFGLARRGFIELTFFFLLSISFLVLSIASLRYWHKLAPWLQRLVNKRGPLLLTFFIAGLLSGWATVTIPPDFFGRFSGYYQWLRPVLVVFGLIALHGGILYLLATGKAKELEGSIQVVKSKAFILAFLVMLLVFAFAYLTGFGIISDTPLWNVPGIPVSGTQMFFAVIIFAGLLALEWFSPKFRDLLSRRWVQVGVLLLVFLSALLIWGNTPLLGDSLSVEPSIANPEPYPRRDARVHDLGALSILYGDGINFRGYTDKPLYMVMLAVFHLVAGYDYKLLEWVQLAFLSMIPVLAYLLAKRFHSSVFGLLVAAMVITQQRNAVVLSRMISSVNVKILVTETFVLLGIILLTWLLFRWNDSNDRRILLLAGGVVGALSLIRLNPILFLPFIGLFIILYYRMKRALIIPRLLIFALGFLIVFLPWVVTGVNQDGQPFVIQKIRDVIDTRIIPIISASGTVGNEVQADTLAVTVISQYSLVPNQSLVASGSKVDMPSEVFLGKNESGGSHYVKLVGNHFVHNYITSIIALPDTLSRKGIRVLAERDYWADAKIWDGKLSSGLIRFIVFNLALVSLGVATSWKKHHWRGLIPLSVFFIYNLAISISLTSGGRYIVPIIWIPFFYYGMGFTFLVEAGLRLIGPKVVIDRESENAGNEEVKQGKLLPALSGILLIALLIPAANLLVPLLVQEDPAQKAVALFSALGPENQSGSKVLTGTILYPTYDPGTGQLSFDINRAFKVNQVSVNLFQADGARTIMNTRLRTGEPVMLVYDSENQLTTIFIFRENRLLEYWSLNRNAHFP